MSIPYTEIKSAVALRSQQLAGSDQAELETAYTAFTLDGAEVPESDLKNTILATEKAIAEVIAQNPAHPYRSYLYARTVDLADLDEIPTVSNTDKQIIGVWDAVADGSNNKPLTLQPTQTIEDLNNSFFDDTDIYAYNINGNFLRITRSTAFLQGCSWDQDTQSTEYDNDGDSPLPPTLTNLWIAGALSNLQQVGWSGADALSYYRNLYMTGLQTLQNGAMQQVPLASVNATSG